LEQLHPYELASALAGSYSTIFTLTTLFNSGLIMQSPTSVILLVLKIESMILMGKELKSEHWVINTHTIEKGLH